MTTGGERTVHQLRDLLTKQVVDAQLDIHGFRDIEGDLCFRVEGIGVILTKSERSWFSSCFMCR